MVNDSEQLGRQLSHEGYCILPGLLSPEDLQTARMALAEAVATLQHTGQSIFTAAIDPNAANVRVYNLPACGQIFIDLLQHPLALQLLRQLLGQNFLVSNFTANIALPGSGSMRLHSDQALVIPPPWMQPWAANVIWCLDDVHERNGATRFVAGSHRYQRFEDVPADALSRTRAFEAPAGSAIVMEGRLWHTSGANVTEHERRAMLFAYYSADFIRQQMNWEAALPLEIKGQFSPETRALFGLGPAANVRIGAGLTVLR